MQRLWCRPLRLRRRPAATWELEQWGCRLRVDQVDWLREVTRTWNRELEDQAARRGGVAPSCASRNRHS